jgi:hypothetical protein
MVEDFDAPDAAAAPDATAAAAAAAAGEAAPTEPSLLHQSLTPQLEKALLESELETPGFTLDTPALVCRWRLKNAALVLPGRTMRAFGERHMPGGERISPSLVAWAKQHIEWTLTPAAAPYEDGVLMVVVDASGKAAMTSGPYVPLEECHPRDLLARAREAAIEAQTTQVAPEVLATFDGTTLTVAASEHHARGAVTTFAVQLLQTMGVTVRYRPQLLGDVAQTCPSDIPVQSKLFTAGALEPRNLVLLSDEHGPVAPELTSGYINPHVARVIAAYATIAAHDAKQQAQRRR